jgi:hypothetical protein
MENPEELEKLLQMHGLEVIHKGTWDLNLGGPGNSSRKFIWRNPILK